VGYASESDGQYGVSLGYFPDITSTGGIAMNYAAYSNGTSAIAIGYRCSTVASYGIGMGYYADIDNTNGIGIGNTATVQGDYSLAIGSNATVTGSNSVLIGYNNTLEASNEVYMGNTTTTTIGGAVNWAAISDKRFKRVVQTDIPGLDFILALKPVSYQFDLEKMQSFVGEKDLPISLRDDGQEKESIRYSGFIAQEVERAAQNLGYDFSGVKVPENPDDQAYGLRYAELVVPLTQAMQELHQMSEQQEATIERYKAMIDDLEKRLQILEGKSRDTDSPALHSHK